MFPKAELQSARSLLCPSRPSRQWCLKTLVEEIKNCHFQRSLCIVCVPQNLCVEILTPKGDDISRWSCWEMVRSQGWSPHQQDQWPYKGNSALLAPQHLPSYENSRSLRPGRQPSLGHARTLVLGSQFPECEQ